MKKYNEKMIIRNGKMVYAIALKEKSSTNNDRNYIVIDNGKVFFTDSWYSGAVEFNFNDDAHKIAKEIFIDQLRTDIKRRVLELKQLEEIFEDLDLKECFDNVLIDNTKRILELENKVNETIDKKIEEQIRPIARKKKAKATGDDKQC